MPNVRETYLRYLACCNERRFEEFIRLVHDPVQFNGKLVPLADYIRAIKENIDAIPNFHWEIEDLVAEDHAIAVRLKDTGTPEKEWLGRVPNGTPMQTREYAFYRFREGRIAEMWFLLDPVALASSSELKNSFKRGILF